MKIAVICANGKAGRLITKEAVDRGFDVPAIVRSKNESAAQQVIQKDLFDLTTEDLRGLMRLSTRSVRGRRKHFHSMVLH